MGCMETLPEHMESLGVAVALFPELTLKGVKPDAVFFRADGEGPVGAIASVIARGYRGKWRLHVEAEEHDEMPYYGLFSIDGKPEESGPFLARDIAIRGTELRAAILELANANEALLLSRRDLRSSWIM